MHGKLTTLVRVALAACAIAVVIPPSASAGRLVVTGHDADHHCGRPPTEGQCHFVQVAVDYVRNGAPDRTKPLLVLDRGPNDMVNSLKMIYGTSGIPFHLVDPRSATFRGLELSTAKYSAIVVASSKGEPDATPQDLNETNSSPDSDAILARREAIRQFFDSGGGLYVNAGNAHGDEPSDSYYAFLPIPVSGGETIRPFSLTTVGRQLGFTDGSGGTPNDINCCKTHNSFEFPSAGSPLRVTETDTQGRAVTLVADAQSFAVLENDPKFIEREVVKSLPRNSRCTRRRFLRLRIRAPKGVTFKRAVVFANWRRIKTLEGVRRVKRPFRVRVKSRGGLFRVRFAVTTDKNRKINIRRNFPVCGSIKKKQSG